MTGVSFTPSSTGVKVHGAIPVMSIETLVLLIPIPLPPGQRSIGPPLKVAVGCASKTMDTLSVAVQPLSSVTVTVLVVNEITRDATVIVFDVVIWRSITINVSLVR